MQRIQEETFGNSLRRSPKGVCQKVFVFSEISIYFMMKISPYFPFFLVELGNIYTQFSDFLKTLSYFLKSFGCRMLTTKK